MRSQAHLLPRPWCHPGPRYSRASYNPSDRHSVSLVRRSFAHSGLHSGTASTITGRPAFSVSERLICLSFRRSLLLRTAAYFVFVRSVELNDQTTSLLANRQPLGRKTPASLRPNPLMRQRYCFVVVRSYGRCYSVHFQRIPGAAGPRKFLISPMPSRAMTRFCSRRDTMLPGATPFTSCSRA